MYFSTFADTTTTDATGQPVTIIGSTDPSIGIPPSVSPDLLDPNTGAVLPVAQPIQPSKPNYMLWLTLGSIALTLFLYTRKKK